ncbi:MAG TPA: methyltransferase domain-containing protein [Opitutaceae bacterium]|jgi:ubiquinone/menaquinone biosynthesis C-methylase UbiE|nr:methyltransferase domain-containing protein [Opitutaceae bacterium]
MNPRSFDRLAGVYRALEYLAFGRDLERARFCFLEKLHACRHVLVLGEGDGRCLAQLIRAAPAAHIDCLDLSPAMLARSAARLPPEARERVTFRCADLLAAELPLARYDAVVTLFFLDCFTAEQAADIVRRVTASLQPGACWLWADFSLPPRGVARLRARAWVALLYAFFRWQTGLPARTLPPAEELILAAGFTRKDKREFQRELVRSAFFSRPGSGTCSS